MSPLSVRPQLPSAALSSSLRPLLILLLIGVAALLVQPGRPAYSSSSVSARPAAGHPPMPTLEGEKAIEHLKQQGMYDSLAEAMAAVKYEARWQTSPKLAGVGAAFEMSNRAQDLLAYVTEDGLEVTALGEQAKPWRMGLKLAAWGYGERLAPVASGKTTAKANRVEIARPAGISEWYVNRARGIEHGFDLASAPGERKEGEPLRLRFAVSGDLQTKADAEGKGVTFSRESGGALLSYSKLFVVDAKGRAVKARMGLAEGGLEIVLEESGAEYPLTIDPLLAQQTKLNASDGAAFDQFGYSVAISGDTVVVGADTDDVGANADQGSAYI